MKLVVRVTATIFILLTVASASIGYFAIAKYKSSGYDQIDASLNSKVKAVRTSSEDSLTVSEYLAQVSAIPVTVEYLEGGAGATPLSESGPAMPSIYSSTTISTAIKSPLTLEKDLRIRAISLGDQGDIIFGESLGSINQQVSVLTKDLVEFIILIDLFAILMAFFVFKRDGRLNELSHLVAAQNKVMQKFLGDASHELRTPLTVIKGYVGLAIKTKDAQKSADYLEKSSTEITRMESLINDLLFLAEVGEKEEESLSNVALGSILQDQIEILQALEPMRTITAEIDTQATFPSNPKLIERAIVNLFSNIRRHTPAESPVDCKLFIQKTKESQTNIVIEVNDGGPGLEHYPQKTRQLKRFTENRSSANGGSGLGLSIISEIVSRYQGTLQLSPSHLGGLQVKIILPLH